MLGRDFDLNKLILWLFRTTRTIYWDPVSLRKKERENGRDMDGSWEGERNGWGERETGGESKRERKRGEERERESARERVRCGGRERER